MKVSSTDVTTMNLGAQGGDWIVGRVVSIISVFFIVNSALALAIYSKYSKALTDREKERVGNGPKEMNTTVAVLFALGLLVWIFIIILSVKIALRDSGY